MTDAQMLQNLLAVQEAMVVTDRGEVVVAAALISLKEVIAELRRRIAENDSHARLGRSK